MKQKALYTITIAASLAAIASTILTFYVTSLGYKEVPLPLFFLAAAALFVVFVPTAIWNNKLAFLQGKISPTRQKVWKAMSPFFFTFLFASLLAIAWAGTCLFKTETVDTPPIYSTNLGTITAAITALSHRRKLNSLQDSQPTE